jgi:hypothetical protein
VREGVIAYQVSGLQEFSNDIGPLLNIASDEKKSRADLMLSEHVQQLQCVRIIGPIIEGERHLLRARRDACEGAPVPLPGGYHGLVAGSACCRRECASCEHASEHGKIVADEQI